MTRIVDDSEVLLEMGLVENTVTDIEKSIVASAITRAQGAIKRYLRYDPVSATRTEFYPQGDISLSSRDAFRWTANDTHAILVKEATLGTDLLQTQHIPIRSITDLRVDTIGRSGTFPGSFSDSTKKVEGVDFWPNYDVVGSDDISVSRDGIIRNAGSWPISPGSVKIVSITGYTEVEIHGEDTVLDASPIMDSVIVEAVRIAKNAIIGNKKSGIGFTPGPVISERLGDYSYKIGTGVSSASDTLFGGKYDLLPETKERLNDFVNWSWFF